MGSKSKKLAVKLDKHTWLQMKKPTEAKTTFTKLRVKKNSRQKSAEPLTKTQKALQAGQAEIRREHQARIQVEKALTEAREALAATRLEAEHERQAQIRRVSFVVRLTLNEQGQFGRTEIEHVSSNRKQNFLSLDGERLVAFMKACIDPAMIPEDGIPPASSKE